MINMKEEVKVSVIIPIYNVEMYLERCLKSVISQSLKNIEIICVDDCSTDNSHNILVDLAEADSRIKIIKNEHNMGLSETRNNGIRVATGKYIFFLDSDDFININALQELYRLINSEDIDVLFFGYNEHVVDCEDIIEHNRINFFPRVLTGKEFFVDCYEKGIVLCTSWAAIYKRQFILEKNLMFKKDILHEDSLFYFEVLTNAERVSSIAGRYYEYMRRRESITLSDENIQKKLRSHCYIINFIIKNTECTADFRLIKAVSMYINNIYKIVYENYKNIKFFDFNDILIHYRDYMMLRGVSCVFYNGFFGYKLPLNVVQDIKKADTVVIYGAGKVGQGLLELLREYDIYVDCFAVTKKDCNDYVSEIKVYQLDELKDKKKTLILIAVATGTAKEMYENAKRLGFNNILNLSLYT